MSELSKLEELKIKAADLFYQREQLQELMQKVIRELVTVTNDIKLEGLKKDKKDKAVNQES